MLSQIRKRPVPVAGGDRRSTPPRPSSGCPHPTSSGKTYFALTFLKLFLALFHKQNEFPSPSPRLARAVRAPLAPIRDSPALRVTKNNFKRSTNPFKLQRLNQAAAFQQAKRKVPLAFGELSCAMSFTSPRKPPDLQIVRKRPRCFPVEASCMGLILHQLLENLPLL